MENRQAPFTRATDLLSHGQPLCGPAGSGLSPPILTFADAAEVDTSPTAVRLARGAQPVRLVCFS
ncbi:MAG: hypothetical protein QOF84_2765, partial [Streptomyces sp.]|nr:hypothetical protein [Streptomyces sp.]